MIATATSELLRSTHTHARTHARTFNRGCGVCRSGAVLQGKRMKIMRSWKGKTEEREEG